MEDKKFPAFVFLQTQYIHNGIYVKLTIHMAILETM